MLRLFTRAVWMAMVVIVAAGCGRKPSREFDAPPVVPAPPQAVSPKDPAVLENGQGTAAGGRDSTFRGETEPPLQTGPAPAIPAGNAPWGPTSTYIPVPSPRVIPGEKAVASPSRPDLPPRDPEKAAVDLSMLPAGTPILVAPPSEPPVNP